MIKNAKNDGEVEPASSPTVPKPTGAFARWPETANEAGESMETTKRLKWKNSNSSGGNGQASKEEIDSSRIGMGCSQGLQMGTANHASG